MFLYKLTNRQSGKSYIGATTRKRLEDRLSLHRHRADLGERQSLLHVAIREHGWESFDVVVLAEPTTRPELLAMEQAAIAAANTMAPCGYNMTAGGDGQWQRRMTEKAKAAIRAANSERKPWNFGMKTGPLSVETRQKMSDGRMGKATWNKGISPSAETRAKMSASQRHGGSHWQAHPLEYQGVTYDCIKDAADATGMSVMQIRYRLQTGRAKDLRPKES